MQNLIQTVTEKQAHALQVLLQAQKDSGKIRLDSPYFTAADLGIAGSVLASLVRKGMAEHPRHTLADYVYGHAARYRISATGARYAKALAKA